MTQICFHIKQNFVNTFRDYYGWNVHDYASIERQSKQNHELGLDENYVCKKSDSCH